MFCQIDWFHFINTILWFNLYFLADGRVSRMLDEPTDDTDAMSDSEIEAQHQTGNAGIDIQNHLRY